MSSRCLSELYLLFSMIYTEQVVGTRQDGKLGPIPPETGKIRISRHETIKRPTERRVHSLSGGPVPLSGLTSDGRGRRGTLTD